VKFKRNSTNYRLDLLSKEKTRNLKEKSHVYLLVAIINSVTK
jgi:hypothetical protein